jgi:hypothetical protein
MAASGRASVRPRPSFQERLLAVMDQKHHWAWPVFSGNRITLDRLKIHFQQEFAVYVRDFPLLLGRLYAKNPPDEIRRELAANLYEEETGGLSVGRSHPALFVEMMRGLGFSERDFSRIRLLPASRAYRQWLDRVTTRRAWIEGLAVMTIFVEGSVKERQELADEAAGHRPKSAEEIADSESSPGPVSWRGSQGNGPDPGPSTGRARPPARRLADGPARGCFSFAATGSGIGNRKISRFMAPLPGRRGEGVWHYAHQLATS